MVTTPVAKIQAGPRAKLSPRVIDVLAALAAIAVGAVSVSSKIFDSSHDALNIAVDGATGVLFVLAGLVASARPEQRRVGRLLIAVGAAWFSEDLVTSTNEIVYSVGQITMVASAPLLVHLVLAFPSGRLEERVSKATTLVAYVLAFVAHPLAQAVGGANRITSCPSCPRGALRYIGWDDGDLFRTLDRTYSVIGTVIALWVVAILAWRYWHASEHGRLAMGPFLAAAITLATAVALGSAVRAAITPGVTRSVVYGVFKGIDSLATMVLPVSFVAGLVRLRLARAADAEQLVTDLSARLQEASASQDTARDEERRRLRNELHDGLGPALAALTLHLDAAQRALATDPERAAALLERIRADAERTIVDLRHAVHGLRPPALDELGFEGAVADLAAGARATLEVELDARELPPLAPAVEAAAFRIVQEALTNTVRHAGAHHCGVRITVLDGSLEILVTDDGCGVNPHARAGVGLRSMRQRAEEHGGELTVDSPPDGGTIIRARLPATSRLAPPRAP